MVFVLFCVFLFFVFGGVFASPLPAPESESLPMSVIEDTAAFLKRNGVDEFGEIIFARRSRNVTDCFQFPDTLTRILQVCAVRTAYSQCSDDTGLVYLRDCQGKQCVGQLSHETSRCIFRSLGFRVRSDVEDEGRFCGLPKGNERLFEWREPAWAGPIGGADNVGCLLSLPHGSTYQSRLFCVDGRPVAQNRVLFPSTEFLGNSSQKINCVSKQSCGLPDLFSSRIVCYEAFEDSQDDDFVVQTLDGELEEDFNRSPKLSYSIPLVFAFSVFLISCVLV